MVKHCAPIALLDSLLTAKEKKNRYSRTVPCITLYFLSISLFFFLSYMLAPSGATKGFRLLFSTYAVEVPKQKRIRATVKRKENLAFLASSSQTDSKL